MSCGAKWARCPGKHVAPTPPRACGNARLSTFSAPDLGAAPTLARLWYVQAVERLLVDELEQLQRLGAALVHLSDHGVALLALAPAGRAHATALLQLVVGNFDLLLRLQVEKLHAASS